MESYKTKNLLCGKGTINIEEAAHRMGKRKAWYLEYIRNKTKKQPNLKMAYGTKQITFKRKKHK